MTTQIIRNANNLEIGRELDRAFPFYTEFNDTMQFSDRTVLAHWHEDMEIIVVYEGDLCYRSDSGETLLRTGDGVIVNQNRLHSLYHANSENCNYLVTDFNPWMLCASEEAFLYQNYIAPFTLGDRSFDEIFLLSEVEWHRSVMKLQLDLYRLAALKADGFGLAVHRQLLAMWELLYEHVLRSLPARPGTGLQKRAIYQAVHFIEEHYSEKIYLADIAESCNLSSTECNRIFHRQVNCSPMEYVIKYRVNRSLPLLADRDRSIMEIAAAVGFDSHSYYSKTFHAYMNCTPKEYRKRLLAKAVSPSAVFPS